MRNLSLVCLLLGSLWWTQAGPTSPILLGAKSAARISGGDDDQKQATPTEATVSPDTAVLTIKGLCAGRGSGPLGDSAGAPCQTVITRAEFEKLTGAIQPDMPPTTRQQFASTYPRMLAMSHEAEQRGLDKREHFQQMIAYARLQILSQELVHDIQEQAAQVGDKDIEDYYRQHLTSFERATLERVLVPIIKQTEMTGASTDVKGKPGAAARIEQESKKAMAKEADRVRERAAAGEDFAKLQRAAYDAAGVDSPIPTTKLANWRRGSLPAAHLSVFDLKVGEISSVISDSTGHYIYKLDSKQMESLEEARKEIHSVLQNQRVRDMMKKVQESVATEVNQGYFRTPAAPKAPDPAAFIKSDSDKD